MTKTQRSVNSAGLVAVAAPLALILIAYPAIAILAPGISDQILLTTSIMLAAVSFNRYPELGWPTLWIVALLFLYIVRTPTGIDETQGVVHTLVLFAIAVTFLTFTIYGSAFVELPGFVPIAIFVAAVTAVIIWSASLQKNAATAQLAYIGALGFTILASRRESNPLRLNTAFFAYVVIVAVSFDVIARGLLVSGFIFLAMSLAAAKLPARRYWLLGIAVSLTTILSAIWFFTSIRASERAVEISRLIGRATGFAVETGRNHIWPYVLRAASENPIFGSGAGALPRDFFRTTLSSHSTYLQTFLQVGVVGLFLLGAFLLSVWTSAAYAKTAAGRFGSAVFIMFVLHNATEVTMFQNNTVVAIPAWCAIGLALSIERSQDKRLDQSKRVDRGLRNGASSSPLIQRSGHGPRNMR